MSTPLSQCSAQLGVQAEPFLPLNPLPVFVEQNVYTLRTVREGSGDGEDRKFKNYFKVGFSFSLKSTAIEVSLAKAVLIIREQHIKV